MFNIPDRARNKLMLTGRFARQGYDWWWHSFTGISQRTGEEKQFFIEFYLCNPALAEDEPVLGQLPRNQEIGKKPSYLMVKAGTWGEDRCQLHAFYPWKDVHIRDEDGIRLGCWDCYLSETALRGSVYVKPEDAQAHPEWMSDAGEMDWDLSVDKKIAFNVGYGAGSLFRRLKAFEMYWHVEGMKTLYSGEVVFNGERYLVRPETSFGYADKNWGSDFTSPWLWLSSCCLKSQITGKMLDNSAFDIGGGCPRAFGIPLKDKLLGALYHEGAEYEFNFSKFWTLPQTEFSCMEGETELVWHVRLENRQAAMIVDVRCEKKDMLCIHYEAPDGSRRHNRLWNGGNGVGRIQLFQKKNGLEERVDDILATHIGCEYGEYDP